MLRRSLKLGHSNDVLEGNTDNAKEQILEFPIASNTLKEGGNCLTISVLGRWLDCFDCLYLKGPSNIVSTKNNPYVFERCCTCRL